MTTLLVVLLLAATLVTVRQVEAFGRSENERQLLDTTRALSMAVDGRLQSYRSMLLGLRASEALARQDWAAFDAQARSVLAGADAWIVLGDRNGRQLVNTRLPAGAPLPKGPSPAIWDSLDKGESRVCDLARGLVEPHILCLDVPVMRNGRAAFHLSVVFRPQSLDSLLAPRVIGSGRLGVVLDSKGVVAWRSTRKERFIGALATADLRRAISKAPEGVLSSRTLEGVPTLAAYSRSPLSGWTFVVGVPRREIDASRQRTLWYGVALVAGLLVLAGGLAVVAARRLTRAIGHLSEAAARMGAGQALAFRRSGLAEVDEVGRILETALEQRDASQESFRLAQEVGGIGAWEWDLEKDQGYVSEGYRAMHGLPPGGGPLRIGEVMAMIHPDDLPGYKERLGLALQVAEPSTNDYRVVRPDGSVRWLYAKGRPQFEADGRARRALGVVMDLTERKEAEERLTLLMREVDHRANNLMAVVQGAVSLSRGDDPATLRQVILGRIEALARAHQLLSASRWTGADLRTLVEEELRPFTVGDPERVTIDGPHIPLSPAAAQGVAMAIHELTSNAAKHGALTAKTGRVGVSWRVADGRLRITWEETGGPPVQRPNKRGFGATVLERALAGSIGGTTTLDWRPHGLACTLDLPAE